MTFSITTTRGVLVDALGTVALAVSARPPLPALGGVLLDTTDGHLTASAFDNETAVTVQVPVTDSRPGRLLVDHREVSKLLTALTKGMARKAADTVTVAITATDKGADATMVTGNGHEVPLESYPVEDYPALPAVPTSTAVFDRKALTREVGRVLVASSGDMTMPFLTGVYTQFRATGVVLAATDRYRLAETTVPAATVHPDLVDDNVLIHGVTLAKVLKRLAGDTVEIGLSDHATPFVSFASGDITVVTRSLDATFPKYKTLLPANADITVVVDRAAVLLDTQRAAAVLDAKRISPTTVGVTINIHGAISVAAVLPDKAASAPDIAADVHGLTEPATYRFAAAYLADALGTFHGETITMHLSSNVMKLAVFTDTPDGLADDTAFKHLVVPVRQPTP